MIPVLRKRTPWRSPARDRPGGSASSRSRAAQLADIVGVCGAAALEGAYFVARTPTPGTGVSSTIQTSFSDTVPFIILFNGDSTGLVNVELDYLKIIITVAGASGTMVPVAT